MNRRFHMRPLYLLFVAVCGLLRAGDWPTYRGDVRRRAVTGDGLSLPLAESWVWRSPQSPKPAWTGPARWDAYSGNRGLQSMRNIDPVFHVSAAAGRVYVPSSADHAVHCLDAATGAEIWRHVTGAPVRFPPTLSEGRAHFGSDDGRIYCVDASSGKRLWVFSPAPARRIVQNGVPIALQPVRTDVMVFDGTVYAAASLLPWERSYLVALDPASGQPTGEGRFVRELTGVTLQGALLASGDSIYIPQGRSAPLTYRRVDGEPLGPVQGAAGVFCQLDSEGRLVAGPANQKAPDFLMRVTDDAKRRTVAGLPGASALALSDRRAFLVRKSGVVAIDYARFVPLQARREALDALRRQQQKKGDADGLAATERERKQIDGALADCTLWSRPNTPALALVLARNALVLGQDGGVQALARSSGEPLWRATVAGKAHGLAVADGRLIVSTDRGYIYTFAHE